MKTKACTKCYIQKPLTSFYKRKAIKGGIDTMCTSCNAIRLKIWVENNQARIKEKHKIWYAQNRERLLARRKELYHQRNPDSDKRAPKAPRRESQADRQRIYKKAIEQDRQKKLDFIMARWEYIQNTYNPTQNNQYPRIPQSEIQQSKTEVRQTSEIPLGINP